MSRPEEYSATRFMSLGLKNAGATYQRDMVTLFHDIIHIEIGVCVDDMIAKSKKRFMSKF